MSVDLIGLCGVIFQKIAGSISNPASLLELGTFNEL
jgi:hypothetical protein